MSKDPFSADIHEDNKNSDIHQHQNSDRILKSIHREVIKEIDGGSFKDTFERLLDLRWNVKILILNNCMSLTSIANHLESLRHTCVFVLIIRLCEPFHENELGQFADKIAISIILQIDNSDSSRLFFKNKDGKLEEVLTSDTNNASLSKSYDFGFICNLLHSNPEKFGKFNLELMEMEINEKACFEGKRLIDLAVEGGDLLAVKFLMLFQPDLEAFNEKNQRILEIAVEKGNLLTLKTILDIPAELESFEAFLSPDKRHSLNLMTVGDLSLLMLAAKTGKLEIITFLLKCGLNVNNLNEENQSACDYAWDNGHLECVIELLRPDSPFPCEYDWDAEPQDSELDLISRERSEVHAQISGNRIDEVKKFVEQNPCLKCVYDTRNQCALVTALESKNFEIYSFLRSKGFKSGIDGDHKILLSELTDKEKEKLKFSNRKYFSTNENSHIMDLVFRSRLGFGSEQKNFEKIQKYFEILDAIPEVRPILEVISKAKKLDVVFDFNQSCIADMDPTQNFKHTVVKGRTIYDNGNILIGAKSRESEVLATMAHEFTHYAMHLLFNNQGFPYEEEDFNQKQEFSEIVTHCESVQSKHAVIQNVFIYQASEYAVELIVRVPHLLALHLEEKEQIAKAREDFGKLFEFFEEKILPACYREIPVMSAKQKISDLNQVLDLKRKTDASKLFCENTKIAFDEIVKTSENILIQTSVPGLVIGDLLNEFKKRGNRNVDSMHIFLKLEQLMDQKFSELISEAFESVVEPKLFVLENENATEFSRIKKFYNLPIMGSKVVTVVKSILLKREDEENFETIFPLQHEIEYNWRDLSEISKGKILSSKMLFQGLEMPLSDILTTDSDILQELTLEEVFQLAEVKLKSFNESVPRGPEVFIKRSFVNCSKPSADTTTAEKIIELLVSERSLIIADESGMGKTITSLHIARKLKQRNPQSWVVFIDLKQHTESYYKDEEDPFEISVSFFSEKILKLSSRVEMKLFEHFYKNGKVIFIIDGFDEISPVYSSCILEAVEIIRKSNNLLLVTTRTHLTKVLEESMPSQVVKHLQFTIDDQIEFLVKFWSRNNKRPLNEFESKARSLLGSLQESMTQEDFFGVPLQVRMLAEIYEKSDPTEEEIRELNVFSLYRSFTRKKAGIWIERGPLAKDDNTVIQVESSFNILQIHQKLAIEKFFPKDLTEALELPEIDENLTDELLARIGLVQVEGPGKFLFTHLTFSEYFVADFVLGNSVKKILLVRSEELHQMFLEVLKDEKFEKVRSFMNGKLELKEKLYVDVLSVKLEKSFEVELNRISFLNLVKENLNFFVIFMLTTIKISKSCKASLVNQKSNYGECALHVAAKFSNSLSSFKQLWNCIESFSGRQEQAELLFAAGFHNRNALNRAILNDKNEIVREILEIASNFMNSDTFKKFMMEEDSFKSNCLHVAARGHFTAFDLLWAAVENKLDINDQKELLFLQELNKRNVLLNAVRFNSPEVVQSILKITENLFDYDEMQKFLFTEDFNRDMALHCAVFWNVLETFTILWTFIKKALNKIDQKIMWKKKLAPNIFMRSLENPTRKTIARNVIAAAREILDPEEICEALTERSYQNATFITVATFYGLVDQIFDPEDFEWVAEENKNHMLSIPMFDGNIEHSGILKNLRYALKGDLDSEQLKAVIYAEAGDGDTVLQFALEYGTNTLADRIFQLVDMRFSSKERLELIQVTSPTGTSILSRSEMNVMAIESVCNFLVRQSDLVSDVRKLFFKTDHFGTNFFTNAPHLNSKSLLVVLDWFKNNFSQQDLRELFFEPNIVSKILAHEVVECCDVSLTKKFFEFCLSSFTLQEVKAMIQIRFYNDHNMLGRSLFTPYPPVVNEVWNFYVKILNAEELEDLMFKNNQGKVYFKKEPNKNMTAVETLKKIVIERFGVEKIRRITR